MASGRSALEYLAGSVLSAAFTAVAAKSKIMLFAMYPYLSFIVVTTLLGCSCHSTKLACCSTWKRLTRSGETARSREPLARSQYDTGDMRLVQSAIAYDSHWDLGQSLDNYQRIQETADLQIQGKAAAAELIARAKDPDSAVRFWAVLGLVAMQSDDADITAALQAASKDESFSVRITAADGLFNLGRYEDGLPAIIAALDCPIPAARIRAAGILDTQPPEANEELRPAVGALRDAASEVNVTKLPGIPYGLNQPFERAIKAITGEESYYRWGPSASGAPRR